MSRIFITGSTDGLGLAAARTLISEGHEVVLHARSSQRAAALSDVASRAAGIVIGDLSSAARTRAVAEQVNELGRMDAIIHNAGIYLERSRGSTPEGHATTHAAAKASGTYWHHRKQQSPAPEAKELAFQNQLLARLAELTGVLMP